jgi:hypothetical protein
MYFNIYIFIISDSVWLLVVSWIFFACSGFLILLTNLQLANLSVSKRCTIITLYCGATKCSPLVVILIQVCSCNYSYHVYHNVLKHVYFIVVRAYVWKAPVKLVASCTGMRYDLVIHGVRSGIVKRNDSPITFNISCGPRVGYEWKHGARTYSKMVKDYYASTKNMLHERVRFDAMKQIENQSTVEKQVFDNKVEHVSTVSPEFNRDFSLHRNQWPNSDDEIDQ